MKIIRLVFAIYILLLTHSTGLFAQQAWPAIEVRVRIDLGIGEGVRDYDAVIDLMTPNDPIGHGTFTSFSKHVSTRKNCNGDSYPYDVIQINNNWVGIIEHNGQIFGCTEAHLEAYWNNQFQGYERVTGVDWTRNCHGYAFGVADWPHTATELLNLGPFLPGALDKACYEASSPKDATIASLPPNHSIKVVGGTCQVAQSGPVPVVPGVPVEPLTIEVIKESTQKFRESGVYRQTANCPNSVDLNKANILKGLDLRLYKRKN